MQKKLLIGVAGLLLLLAVFIWQVAANLDSIVAAVIEDVGSDVLKTKVSVAGVTISLKEGKATIAGLKIANPDGYSSANLFTMEGIEVDLDLRSLSDDVLVIESILIRNPQIVFEGNDAGGSNMQALLDNIEKPPAWEGEDSDDAFRMIIDRFEFTGGEIKLTTPLIPGETTELNLPSIKMLDIGRSQGGVTAEVVVTEVTSELVSVVIEAALKAELSKVIEKQKQKLMDKLGKKLFGDG